MRKTVTRVIAAALLMAGVLVAAGPDRAVIVTSSNTADNRLLVYDTAGALVQEVPTLGQGGASGNAGAIATSNGIVAVANFGSHTVSLFSRGEAGFELRQTMPTSSQPVSVALGKTHLYVLGTSTVESHRIGPDAVEASADGTAGLLIADGSTAQVGVAADELIVTEKSGALERVQLVGFEEIPPEELRPALLSVIDDETRRGLGSRRRVAMRRSCVLEAPADRRGEHTS